MLPIAPGDNATFVFAPGGNADRLSVAIAIGYRTGTDGLPVMAAAGAAYDIDLSTEHLNVYPITLAPAPTPRRKTRHPARDDAAGRGHRVGPARRRQRAPVRVLPRPARGVCRAPVFVIEDPTDQDCDGHEASATECEAEVFDAVAVPPTEPSCALIETDSVGSIAVPMCRAGGPTCTDGIGPAVDGCEAGPFCLQMSVCERCDNLAPAAMWGCVANLPVLSTPPSYSYFKLTVPYTVSSTTVVLTEGEATSAAAGQFPAMGRCTRVEFATREGELVNELDRGFMKIAADVMDSCDLTIKVVRGSTSPAMMAPVNVLLAVGLEDGSGAALNSLLVPLEVKLVQSDALSPSLTQVGGLASQRWRPAVPAAAVIRA